MKGGVPGTSYQMLCINSTRSQQLFYGTPNCSGAPSSHSTGDYADACEPFPFADPTAPILSTRTQCVFSAFPRPAAGFGFTFTTYSDKSCTSLPASDYTLPVGVCDSYDTPEGPGSSMCVTI